MKDQLVEAVGRSRSAKLDEILGALSRDRLKELCREFKLDDSGKEKAAIVDRLVNGKAAAREAVSSTTARVAAQALQRLGAGIRRRRARLLARSSASTAWSGTSGARPTSCAGRSTSDYKNFIFGLLFLKRLSDRFDEECEPLVAEGARPRAITTSTSSSSRSGRAGRRSRRPPPDLGEVLNKASRGARRGERSRSKACSPASTTTTSASSGDARNRDNVLHRLVLHFSKVEPAQRPTSPSRTCSGARTST